MIDTTVVDALPLRPIATVFTSSGRRGPIVRRGISLVRSIAALTVLAGISAGGYFALAGGGKGDAGAVGAKDADHAVVRVQSFDMSINAGGQLESRKQIEIRNQLDGEAKIVELTPEGSSVKAGDLLVRLSSEAIEQQLLQETLEFESAQADAVAAENAYAIQVNENESKLKESESKVKLAELALEQWEKAEVEKKRLELTLALEKATEDRQRLREKVEQSNKLLDQGFLSRNEFKLDEIQLKEAEAAVRKAELDAESYWKYTHVEEREKKTSELDKSRSELARVKLNNESELASKLASRDTKKKMLTVREEQIKTLRKQVESAVVKAPADGLVVYASTLNPWRWSTPMQIGSEVYSNQLLIVLPDTTEMIAAVKVHESLAGRIEPGQSAVVRIDALGGKTFAGKVESLSVMASNDMWSGDSQTREYTVKIGLNKSDLVTAGLKPSMRVESTVTLGRIEEALSLPVQAVFNEGQVHYIYRKSGSSYEKTPVKLGRKSDTLAEVAAGVSAGDVVLLREPRAGEATSKPWDKAALEIAGYELDKDGKAVVKAEVPVVSPPGPAAEAAPGTTAEKTSENSDPNAPKADSSVAGADAAAGESKPVSAPASETSTVADASQTKPKAK